MPTRRTLLAPYSGLWPLASLDGGIIGWFGGLGSRRQAHLTGMVDQMNSLTGYLLVASAQLRDPNFVKTVVLILQHSDKGGLGLILNRPTSTSISDAWGQVSDLDCQRSDPLHHGGPCESPLMVVHTHEAASQIAVTDEIHFCTEKQNVEMLIVQEAEPVRFFVGCAGWAPGQLEQEMETGSWLTLPATIQQVFGSDENLWIDVTRQIARAVTYSTLNPKIIPKDPSMN